MTDKLLSNATLVLIDSSSLREKLTWEEDGNVLSSIEHSQRISQYITVSQVILDAIAASPDYYPRDEQFPKVFTQYFFIKNEDTLQTTSNKYQEALILTTPDLPAGNYRISWYYEYTNNSTNGVVVAGIFYENADGGITPEVLLAETAYEPEDVKVSGLVLNTFSTSSYLSQCGFDYLTLDGITTLKLKYRNAEQSTSYIRNMKLELWRVL